MPDDWVDKGRQASLDWRAKRVNDPPKLSVTAYERVRIGMRGRLDAEDAEPMTGTTTRFHCIVRITKAQHQVPQQQVAALVCCETD